MDALQAGGASVHLAHPLGVKAFEYRRVKTFVTLRFWRTCRGWATCRRRGSRVRRPGSYSLTPKHDESNTHVHRGRITKQASRLVRWAAIDLVKNVPAASVAGVVRERVAGRRGRNVGSVAAARRQLEFVFYALPDGHVRPLEHLPRVA